MPWYRDTVEDDRARIKQIEALRYGLEVHPARNSIAALKAILPAVAPYDADAFRAIVANRNCLALNEDIFADESFTERVLDIAHRTDPPPLPGPNRDQLLALLDATPATA